MNSETGHTPLPTVRIALPGEGAESHRLRTPHARLVLEGVRRVEPEEEFLLEHLPAAIGARTLIPLVHGAPALAAALAALYPGCAVEVWEPDLHDARLLRDKLAALRNVTVNCTPDMEADGGETVDGGQWTVDGGETGEAAGQPEGSMVSPSTAHRPPSTAHRPPSTAHRPPSTVQSAFLIIRRDSDRLMILDAVERFSSVLPPGSPVLLVLPKKRADDFRQKLGKLLKRFREVARSSNHLLFAGDTLAESVWTPRAARFTASTPAAALELLSRPGVFCHGRPDAGGTALAESVELPPGQKVLELGCGCGTTALLLAAALRQASQEPGRFTLVDSDARAVACAQDNIAANGFADSMETVLDDEYLPALGAYDWFLGNPPYYAGHRICGFFLEVAAAALRPGGTAVVVSKHKEEVRELAEARGFRVIREVKRRGYDVTFCERE